MSKKYLLVFIALVMSGTANSCSKRVNNNSFVPDNSQVLSATAAEEPITIQVALDTPPFITAQTGELSGVALLDDGKIIKYQTLKIGATYAATTIVYEKKWVILESHKTTSTEAQTILKLASQGGYAKEFKAMRDRYAEIGLIDLR
jgi:hypothetical protein